MELGPAGVPDLQQVLVYEKRKVLSGFLLLQIVR